MKNSSISSKVKLRRLNMTMKRPEQIAKALLERILNGAQMNYRCDQSASVHDFDLIYPGGHIAAVEVTTSADQRMIDDKHRPLSAVHSHEPDLAGTPIETRSRAGRQLSRSSATFADCPGTPGGIRDRRRSSDGDNRRGGAAGNQVRVTTGGALTPARSLRWSTR
jgi:hypothetical protein